MPYRFHGMLWTTEFQKPSKSSTAQGRAGRPPRRRRAGGRHGGPAPRAPRRPGDGRSGSRGGPEPPEDLGDRWARAARPRLADAIRRYPIPSGFGPYGLMRLARGDRRSLRALVVEPRRPRARDLRLRALQPLRARPALARADPAGDRDRPARGRDDPRVARAPGGGRARRPHAAARQGPEVGAVDRRHPRRLRLPLHVGSPTRTGRPLRRAIARAMPPRRRRRGSSSRPRSTARRSPRATSRDGDWPTRASSSSRSSVLEFELPRARPRDEGREARALANDRRRGRRPARARTRLHPRVGEPARGARHRLRARRRREGARRGRGRADREGAQGAHRALQGNAVRGAGGPRRREDVPHRRVGEGHAADRGGIPSESGGGKHGPTTPPPGGGSGGGGGPTTGK